MSVKADFESLKQQILEVVTKDPDVRYILVGWMTEEFVPKTDYSKILDELKDMRERSDQRWKENNKRWEENDKYWKEANRRFEEAAAERQKAATDRQAIREDMNQRFDKQDARMDQEFHKLRQHMDRMGSRWGKDAEQAFKNGLMGLMQDFFQGTVETWRIRDKEGFVRGKDCEVELDIVSSNGLCIVVEIKSKPSLGDVTIFERKVALYERQTGKRPDRRVMVVMTIEPEVLEDAQASGIEILTTDDLEQ